MILALLLAACTVPAPDLARPTAADPRPVDPASPPPAAGPEGEKLYQVLYAGELGAETRALGQRTRVLAWLAAMELDPAQLDALGVLAVDVQQREATLAVARTAVGVREQAALGPVYADLEARLARPDPMTEAESTVFAERLGAARAVAYEGKDPRALHYAGVTQLLLASKPWIESLTSAQRTTLAESRFFLGRRLGPFVNPGDYGSLVGTMWDGGDFGSLRATVRPTDEGHMDLGGLWSIEAMQAGPDRRLEGLQVAAILFMALEEPELPAAIALRKGAGEQAGFTGAEAPASPEGSGL
ncbi:MAG: hypothetical protein Q8P18_34800 [Pseudomonadota bacterium]|nr:hypothetical protein [Pseudomonadota bacterium]